MIKITPDAIEMYMLPLWTVEIKQPQLVDAWERIPGVCYEAKQGAEKHVEALIANRGYEREVVRAAEYTTQHWREDLIDMILDDRRLIAVAVSRFDTETLLKIVKAIGEAK